MPAILIEISKKLCLLFLFVIVLQNFPEAQTNQQIRNYPGILQYGSAGNSSYSFDQSPDLEFKASVTGEINQAIEFTLKGNIPGQYMTVGNFVPSMKLFRVNITGQPQMVLGWGVIIPEMKAGVYKMNESPLAVGGYMNPQLSKHSFNSTSGSMTVTKAEKHKSYSGTMDWFIDGSFEMELESGNDPDKKITIKGSFKGMGIKEN